MIPGRVGDLILRIQQREADLAQLRAKEAALHRAQVADIAALTEALHGAEEELASEALAAKVEQLRAACSERGIRVTGDDFVAEGDAATLLVRSPLTVRNWRTQHAPMAWRRRGKTPEYSLETVARYLLDRTEAGAAGDF